MPAKEEPHEYLFSFGSLSTILYLESVETGPKLSQTLILILQCAPVGVFYIAFRFPRSRSVGQFIFCGIQKTELSRILTMTFVHSNKARKFKVFRLRCPRSNVTTTIKDQRYEKSKMKRS